MYVDNWFLQAGVVAHGMEKIDFLFGISKKNSMVGFFLGFAAGALEFILIRKFVLNAII